MKALRVKFQTSNRVAALVLRFVVVIGALGLLGGCATPFQRHRDRIDDLADAGAYGEIISILEGEEARSLYEDRDRLLYYLDLGLARFAAGDDEGAIDALTTAESIMATRFEENAGDVFAKLVLNDSLAAYLGEPYEDIDVNVFKLLAQLELGRIQGGATVEARRLAAKVDRLREEHLTLTKTIREDAGASGEPDFTGAPSVVATAKAGQFIASPLGEFLTAITFMLTGDHANQAVAARRLVQSIEAQGELIGPVDPAPFAPLEDLRPGDVNVLAVAFAGPGPRKRALRVGPIPIYDTPIYFELPVLERPISETSSVVIGVQREDGSLTEAPLHLVEDMARVATINHERQLPQIYLRTLLRAASKSAALTVTTRSAEKSNGEGAELAALIGGLVLLTITEKADLRSSRLLPGQAYTGLLNLSPGTHRIVYRFLDDRGYLIHESLPTEITVSDRPDEFNTVIEWHWR